MHVLLALFVFVCVWWCQVNIVLWFCFIFRRLVCTIYVAHFSGLSIVIVPSVFSDVYLYPYFDCPFGIL